MEIMGISGLPGIWKSLVSEISANLKVEQKV